MTAAPMPSQPAEALNLPAPYIALPRPTPAPPLRRRGAGITAALLLHGAALGGLMLAVGDVRTPPVTPPQPYLTVSLATPDSPAPAPQPRPQQKLATPPKPEPRVQPRPTPQARAADTPTLGAAATAANPVEATAPAVPPSAAPAPAVHAPTPAAVTPPRFDAAYLSNPAPPYPSASRKMGEEGRVLLRVQVGADGRPTDVSVVRSSGYDRLDDIARETVLRSWRFVPARQGDQPVAGAVKVPIDFTLSSAS